MIAGAGCGLSAPALLYLAIQSRILLVVRDFRKCGFAVVRGRVIAYLKPPGRWCNLGTLCSEYKAKEVTRCWAGLDPQAPRPSAQALRPSGRSGGHLGGTLCPVATQRAMPRRLRLSANQQCCHNAIADCTVRLLCCTAARPARQPGMRGCIFVSFRPFEVNSSRVSLGPSRGSIRVQATCLANAGVVWTSLRDGNLPCCSRSGYLAWPCDSWGCGCTLDKGMFLYLVAALCTRFSSLHSATPRA